MNNSYTDAERLNILARRICDSGIDFTANQRDWTILAYACASQGEAGREAFHLISANYPQYSREECDRHYDYCLRTTKNRVSLGTLMQLCKDHGIDTAMPRGRRPKTEQQHKEEKANIIALVSEQLREGRQWRKNIISEKVEYSTDGQTWLEMDDRMLNTLITRLRMQGLRISEPALRALIDSSDFSVDFNPVTAYLDNLQPWDPQHDPDYISQMFVGHMTFGNEDDRQFYDQVFHRWFTGMVALWKGIIEENPLLPTFCGSEQIGKTFFCKHILPPCLRPYWTEVRPNDPLNTDTMLTLSRVLLIILDEIRISTDTKSNMLKYLMTSSQTTLRASYDRFAKTRQRKTSFIATTNFKQFIRETEGNRRYVGIDLTGTTNIKENPINYDGAYAQAVYLLNNGYQPKPTREESMLIKEHNQAFMQMNDCEQALLTFVRQPQGYANVQILTPGDLLQELNNRGFRGTSFNTNEIGRSLTRLGFKSKKTKRGNGYYLSTIDYEEQKRERNALSADEDEMPF